MILAIAIILAIITIVPLLHPHQKEKKQQNNYKTKQQQKSNTIAMLSCLLYIQ